MYLNPLDYCDLLEELKIVKKDNFKLCHENRLLSEELLRLKEANIYLGKMQDDLNLRNQQLHALARRDSQNHCENVLGRL